MKVAVVGCAGFIGSVLTEACLKQGWDVVGIDSFFTGSVNFADVRRYLGLPGRYSFQPGDVSTMALDTLFTGVEIVFLLAALPNNTNSVVAANNTNVTGTLNVLEAARKAGVARVVFSSSDDVYAEGSKVPIKEAAKLSPRNLFASQKTIGEQYCKLYSELYGLDTVSLRYFTVFGPNQFSKHLVEKVIPACFSAAFFGSEFVISGDGTQRRDFCYIDDAVQANILAATCKKPLGGEAINIASGESHSVLGVCSLVDQLVGHETTKKFLPEGKVGSECVLADITRAKKKLKYSPKVSFEEGMKITYLWWKAVKEQMNKV